MGKVLFYTFVLLYFDLMVDCDLDGPVWAVLPMWAVVGCSWTWAARGAFVGTLGLLSRLVLTALGRSLLGRRSSTVLGSKYRPSPARRAILARIRPESGPNM